MPRLYIDQDALGLAPALSALGNDVKTTRDIGLGSGADEKHFLFAVQDARTLITHNIKDFQMLHRAWLHWEMQPPHRGLLIVPQRLAPDFLAGEITSLLESDRPLQSECYVWSRGTGWRRYMISNK